MVAYIQTMEEHSDCIHNVKLYIREHINEPLHREVLAEVAGFSIPHFHRIFTAQISSMEARDWKIKTHPFLNVFFWREERDANIISSMEACDWKIKHTHY